jgi:DNA polymerase-3 subunit chi
MTASPDMTKIDFHSNVPDKLLHACRLARKAHLSDFKVVIYSPDQELLSALDRALWTFSEQDFLPHVMAGDSLAAKTPLILSSDAEAELPHHQVLINLSAAVPDHFARFERLIEIVSAQQEDQAAGRERYGFYRQRGYPLRHFPAESA